MSSSEDYICNVLLVGQTGAGKSSLLNYLCNKKVAETGAGKPVTGEGIYEYNATINKQKVRLFDSWGIEPGKTKQWDNLITEALKKHGVQNKIENWFHCIIYCIQVGRERILPVETNIIKRILSDGYHLTIVLTKADQVKEKPDVIKKLKEEIIKQISEDIHGEKLKKINIISTCTEDKKIRCGNSKPFGKEEVIASIFDGWKETIIERMPKHIIGQICETIDEWATIRKTYIPSNIAGNKSDNKYHYLRLIEYAKDEIDYIQEYALPSLLKDSLNSCQRTARFLSRIFNHGIYIIDNNILKNVELGLLNAHKTFSDYFKFNSKKNIASQEEELCAFVDKLAEEIKNEVKNKEKQLAIILEDFLH